MDARNAALSTVAFLVFVVGACSATVFATSTHTYPGRFNLPIPAEQDNSKGWMEDAVIEVTEHFIISDLDVRVNITHSNVFDLELFLQSPAETILCLNVYNFDEFFNDPNYTETIFDDEALIPIELGLPPFTGRFKPRAGSLLQVFDGQDAFGQWKLRIYDWWYADTGTLDSFELIFTAPEPATAILLLLGTGLVTLLRPHRERNHI